MAAGFGGASADDASRCILVDTNGIVYSDEFRSTFTNRSVPEREGISRAESSSKCAQLGSGHN